MRTTSLLLCLLLVALLLACGGVGPDPKPSPPAPEKAPDSAVQKPEPPRRSPKVIREWELNGEKYPIDVSTVWHVFDTDRVKFERLYQGNEIEITLSPAGAIQKDGKGYYIERADYNVRRNVNVYLRDRDARRLSDLYGGKNVADMERFRLRVTVGADLSFTDGHIVPR